jgi:hypothetical protein
MKLDTAEQLRSYGIGDSEIMTNPFIENDACEGNQLSGNSPAKVKGTTLFSKSAGAKHQQSDVKSAFDLPENLPLPPISGDGHGADEG